MNKIPFIDLKSQYTAYKDEIDTSISNVINSCSFVQGPEVSCLEDELSSYVGSRYCITCSSGTSALFIALRAVGIGSGDEVIIPGFSFFATASVVDLVGAVPVFIDIQQDSFTLDPRSLEEKITDKTRAIIPVSLFGQTADMDVVNKIAEKYGITVIEDGAQSFGATYKKKKSCNISSIGCTSFYPSKPLGSYGEGGAVFTNDAVIAERMRQIMNQGQKSGYEHVTIGINGRMQSIQAAILRVKLRHFDEELNLRQTAADYYNDGLKDIDGILTPRTKNYCFSVYAQYTIRTTQRKALISYLNEQGIPTAIHYSVPIYRQDAYSHYGHEWLKNNISNCPNCEKACDEVFSLPFGPFINSDDQRKVIQVIKAFMEGQK